jgi:hypothetical protein
LEIHAAVERQARKVRSATHDHLHLTPTVFRSQWVKRLEMV